MPDGIDMSTAMKLIHSSNAKKMEAEKDPLAKEVLSSLKELKKLQIDLNKAAESKDDAKVKLIQDSINTLKKNMSDKGVSESFMSEGGEEKLKDYLSEKLINEIKNDMGELTDDTVAALVKMMQTGKSAENNSQLSKDMEESLILAMSATLSKSGLTNSKDIKDVLNYLKSMKTDMSVTNDSISEIVQMNKNLNNQLVNLTKDTGNNAYLIADKLAVLDDAQLQMLVNMEDMPSHIMEAVEIEERRRKLKDYPFGGKLLEMEESFGKFGKKWEKWGNALKDPLGFIKPMFKTVGNIISLIWKTIIPTLVSMAVSFFTVVLPIALLIIGVIFVILFLIYAFYTGFWKAFKKLGGIVWDLLLDYLKFVWEHPVVGTITSILIGIVAYNTAMKAWHALMWTKGLIQSFVRFIPMIFGWLATTGLPLLGSILAAIPVIGWIILAIGVIVGFVWYFRKEIWAFMKKVFDWIWEGLKWYINLWAKVISWVWDGLKKGWDLYMTAWKTVYDWILGGFKYAWDGLKAGWDKFVIGWNIVSGWLMDGFKYAWEGVKSYIEWIWGSVQKVWGFITDMPGKLVDGVKNIIGSIGDALNPFNWFADGGIVSGPTKAIIGEAGPEAVVPLSGSSGNNFTNILNDFFDTYLPFFKPLINFLWDNLKPYLPVLQAVLDAVYSVVYSIISGLSQLPGWLGGGFFKDMLSRLAAPAGGGGNSGSSGETDTKLLLSIISGDIEDKPVLGLVGKNESQMIEFDSSKRPMGMDTMMKINSFITGASASMEEPKYAQNLQKGIESIGEGIESLAGKLDKMEKNIVGAVGQSGKTVAQDKQFELSKLLSRNSFNGGKV